MSNFSKRYAIFAVLVAVMTDTIVYSTVIPLMTFMIEELNISTSFNGILLAIYGFGMVVGSLFFGYIGSHYTFPKKGLMICAVFGLSGSTIMFALGEHVWSLALARFLQGFSSNGAWVIGMSVITDYHLEDENLGSAMSIVMGGYNFGLMVGPPIGGMLFKFGRNAPFAFCGVLLLVDLVCLSIMTDPPEVSIPGQPVISPVRNKTERSAVLSVAKIVKSSNFDKNANSELTARDLETNSHLHIRNSAKRETVSRSSTRKKAVVLKDLFKYKQLWLILALNFALSMTQNSIEPTLPSHLSQLYAFGSSRIGLVWLSMTIPLVLGGFLGGYLYDKIGLTWTCSTLVITGFSIGTTLVPISPAIGVSVRAELITIAYSLMTMVWAIGGWMWQFIAFGCFLGLCTVYCFFIAGKSLTGQKMSFSREISG
ncbi:major facilitator superfamily domain-containing protein [Obelidium mucronatum]|nr:major facilitator superfamily domain-containing protein [Obelidium mucronatum]